LEVALANALDLDREQRTAISALHDKFDGTATDLAILYIRGLIGRQVNASVQPLAAVRTLDGNKFLGEQPGTALSRLKDRLEPIQGIDAARIEVRDTAGQRVQLLCFMSLHLSILRHSSPIVS
jgi:hypothetical protein